jgi:hypothetical protein
MREWCNLASGAAAMGNVGSRAVKDEIATKEGAL